MRVLKRLGKLLCAAALTLCACAQIPENCGNYVLMVDGICQWGTYTITFDATGGSLSASSAKTGSDGKLTYLPTPSKSDNTFKGWYTAGGSQVTMNTVFGGNTTIYAQWTVDLVTPPGGGGGDFDPDQIEMVFVQGGTFIMGCNNGDTECYDNEKPQHSVTLNNYSIGKYEVTQGLWKAVMGSIPSSISSSYGIGDNYPVYYVSWNDVQTFIQTLNSKVNRSDGMKYRLPTEAEWEYAARGGKSEGYKYSGSDNIDKVTWYYGNSDSKTHTVGGKDPNGLGIYDMSGNVYEWVSDWYGSYSSSAQTNPKGADGGSYRVLRGGSWYYDAEGCRVSFRDYINPVRSGYMGFRLVLSSSP